MVKLMISIVCGILCMLSCAQSRSVEKVMSAKVDITIVDNHECLYNRWDSTLLIFRSGSNGLLEIILDSISIYTKEVKVNRNEGISDIVKVSRNSSLLVVKHNERQAEIKVNPDYGIIYFDRLDSSKWFVTYDNCFYPARK